MNETVPAWLQHPALSAISLLLAALGILLAVIFYVKGRRLKALEFEVVNRTLVQDLTTELDGLEVRYKGVPQARVTTGQFVFWNSGTVTIRSDDLTDAAPLGVVVAGGAEVLDARVVRQTEPANQISIGSATSGSEDGGIFIPITFDYLDPSDGAVLQVTHTGDGNHRLSIGGKIKGASWLRRVRSPAHRVKRMLPGPVGWLAQSRIFGWFGAATYLAIAVAGIYIPLSDNGPWIVSLLTPVALLAAWMMARAYGQKGVPNELSDRL